MPESHGIIRLLPASLRYYLQKKVADMPKDSIQRFRIGDTVVSKYPIPSYPNMPIAFPGQIIKITPFRDNNRLQIITVKNFQTGCTCTTDNSEIKYA
jgi:Tfp pilus assembly protein PilZ